MFVYTLAGDETLYLVQSPVTFTRRTAVPEPSTLGLFALAVAGLALLSRRRALAAAKGA